MTRWERKGKKERSDTDAKSTQIYVVRAAFWSWADGGVGSKQNSRFLISFPPTAAGKGRKLPTPDHGWNQGKCNCFRPAPWPTDHLERHARPEKADQHHLRRAREKTERIGRGK